jgi:hypothetical protein
MKSKIHSTKFLMTLMRTTGATIESLESRGSAISRVIFRYLIVRLYMVLLNYNEIQFSMDQ